MSRGSVAVLLATWERDVAEAGPLNKKDLRPERFIADLKAALTREAAPQATPSSRWAANGEPDPHGNTYDCERAALAMGDLTDDELANAVFLHGDENPSVADLMLGNALPAIAYLMAAKDRIRWLSRRLATTDSAIQSQQGATGGSDWQHIANEWADAATNGLQWLRNVRDGVCLPEKGIAEMVENIARIRALAHPQAAGSAPGEAQPARLVKVWDSTTGTAMVAAAADYFTRADLNAEYTRGRCDGFAAAGAGSAPVGVDYQDRVGKWMDQCFPRALYGDMTQRCDRFLEEALELLQAQEYDRSRVATLVDYVWGRPVGHAPQEVGGTVVTLAALCWVAGIDMQAEASRELARIEQPAVMAKIRAKQEAKNALHFDSPLPGDAALSLASTKERAE